MASVRGSVCGVLGMYGGLCAGISMEGLKYEPGIGGRKAGRTTERARLTDFDGAGTGVEGSPEGRGKAAAMGPVRGGGGPVDKVGIEMVRSPFLIDC
jgi:hypothetical protein